MSIWLYKDRGEIFNPAVYYKRAFPESPHKCPACTTPLSELGRSVHTTEIGRQVNVRVCVCQVCGWWDIAYYYAFEIDEGRGDDNYTHYGAGYTHGTLKNIDVGDVKQPLEEISRFLVAKNEALGYVNPELVEDVVSSVFRNLGYTVEQTPLIGDNGIDVYLLNNQSGEREVGIQVKRWNRKISVEPIRSFLGALMLDGLSKGIVVATGRFTSGPEEIARKSQRLGLATIELRDGSWLINALRCTQRASYDDLSDPHAPFRPLLEEPHLIPSWDFYKQFD